jgi:hypothetical protein
MFNGSKLVFNTGRSLEETLLVWVEGFKLPYPDMLAACTGSTLYRLDYNTGKYVLDMQFFSIFDKNNWDSAIVSNLLNENFPWLIVPHTRHEF